MNDFEEYIRQSEPNRQQRAYAWRTAIGLQAVDGLKPSDYLKDTARKHIEGDIDIDEAQRLIKSYYQSKTIRTPDDDDLEEADIVSSHIAKILGEQSFAFSIVGITSIHRRLFEGVFKFAGKIRDYDITKKEWLNTTSSITGSFSLTDSRKTKLLSSFSFSKSSTSTYIP